MGAAGQGPDRPDIREILEPLAAKVHEVWARQRKAEGWTWGALHNVASKQHPCLTAYEQLSESEKEVDRQTARTSVQGLLDLGFEIVPPRRKRAGEAQFFEELLRRLASTASIALAELRSLWSQCRSSPFRCPAEIHLRLGERMLKHGEAIWAYDVLAEGLDTLAQDDRAEPGREALRLRVSQLLALALAQSGASNRSEGILRRLCEQGCTTPETLGLLGRVYKDLAGKETSPEGRDKCLEQSFQSYAAGFAQADSALRLHGRDSDGGDAGYCGINAAAVLVLRNHVAEARILAGRVRQICLDRSRQLEAAGAGPDYWLAATLAEAELIGGSPAGAEAAYRRAAEMIRGNWRELCSTRRQARLLVPSLNFPASFLDHLFPPISIAVCCAPTLARLAPEAEMKAWEQRQADEFKRSLSAAGVVAGYATASSPADLLFIEALLETAGEINVVLPCPPADCRRFFESSPEWAARFDRILSSTRVSLEEAEAGRLDGTANGTFARQRALGAGLLRARRLDAALQVWGVADDGSGAAPGTSSPGFSYVPLLSCPYESIQDDPWPGLSGPPRRSAGDDRRENYSIRAMLFGDVKGYSRLSDVELLRFAREFMPRVAGVLAVHSARILSRRTAGDGLFLVFADLDTAATVALQLRDMVAGTRWDECGLPKDLGIRISLDAGPVCTFEDPVTHNAEVCGAYVNRAARIEPITPPNQVYASEAFASLAVAAGGRAFRFDYVGRTELPKGFGVTPLYCVDPEGV